MTCITNIGSDQGFLTYQNADFSRTSPAGQTGNILNQDGQLWIGRTTPTACGATIGVGNITSTDGSISVINGPGSIDIRGQTAGFQPNAALQEFDDFIEGGTGNKLVWTGFGGSAQIYSAGTVNNPGILLSRVAGINGGLYIGESNNSTQVGPIALGGGVTTVNWVVQLPSLSAGGNTYRFSCGLADGVSLSNGVDTFVNGVYFQYTNAVNGGQWTINCTNSSTTTTVNTNVAANTSFVTLSIVANAAASSISFYINNIAVGTAITTNIPTASLAPFFSAVNLSGTTPNILADLFWITIALSNPRPGPTSTVAPFSNRQILSYTQTATSYQVLGTDAIIGVTDNSSARTITMPNTNLVAGQVWNIKDEAGTAQSSHNITISGNGVNIDGASTFVINTNYGEAEIYYNGVKFFIK
jgi:hypothetical protein